MTAYVDRAGLSVDPLLVQFVEARALPGTGIDASAFWAGFAAIITGFTPENRALLATRAALQAQIDDWHRARAGKPQDSAAYRRFLDDIGYLVREPAPFTVGTANVDPEIAALAGPQLVVPALNARFALNAANARWGSLYDALYGTDALAAPAARPGGYDTDRGAAVIARAKAFLDSAVPLAAGTWADWAGGQLTLADPAQWAGSKPGGILLRHNGLHIELVIDPDSAIGRGDPAGIADVVLESALTTIIDLEDSVAAVDGADKVLGYANWLGLMRGDLTESFAKGGQMMTARWSRTVIGPHPTVQPLPCRGAA